MKLKVCIAGATGWAGSALAHGVIEDNQMDLVAAVSRKNNNGDLAQLLNHGTKEIPIFENVNLALSNIECDVMVEYTHASIAKQNILLAVKKGINVVVGTSGLSDQDYSEIKQMAIQNKVAVLAVGNFALTAVLLQKFSEMAAKYIPNFEIIDYAHQSKKDCPSGTARELSSRLSALNESTLAFTKEEINGPKATRGARINGVQVHSVRLPGHVIAVESIFGLTDEKLTIRHDAGSSAQPYVQGGLLAIKKGNSFIGLKRGLDTIMDF